MSVSTSINSKPGINPGLVLTIVVGLLAGCAVGPNFKKPRNPVPESFSSAAQTNLNLGSTSNSLATWWRDFNDAKLNELMDGALSNNLDLRIALANLKESRALRSQARFDLFPTVTSQAGYTKGVNSLDAEPGFSRQARETSLNHGGFDATWELDFFGRVRRSVQSASAQVGSAEASFQDVQVSVVAEVARNYFELRGLQNQLSVNQRNAQNQRQTWMITQSRLEGGRGTQLDVARAESQYELTLSGIPGLEEGISEAIHRLAVLNGKKPEDLEADLSQTAPMPVMVSPLYVGNPEEMLRRRPDVRAAERQLESATAQIGVVTADLFPRVTFSGSIGLEASSFSRLDKSGADTWSFGPHLTWAALDLGRVRARIRAADARKEAQLAIYEQTVLTALEETENAIVRLGRSQSIQQLLDKSAGASQQAAELAKQKYENGSADFLTELDAERVMFESQDRLAQSQTQSATALVAVYKALGGGWKNAPVPVAGNAVR